MKVSSKEGDFCQENVKFVQLIILGFFVGKISDVKPNEKGAKF